MYIIWHEKYIQKCKHRFLLNNTHFTKNVLHLLCTSVTYSKEEKLMTFFKPLLRKNNAILENIAGGMMFFTCKMSKNLSKISKNYHIYGISRNKKFISKVMLVD